MDKTKVKLFNIISDDLEEFADLIGQTGVLHETVDGLSFHPNKRGDFLTMLTKSKTDRVYEGDEIVIKSKMGNTFKFKVL